MIRKYLYRRYQEGKRKIEVVVDPDHLADCIDVGHIRKIKFKSGNIYNCKFCKSIRHTYGGLYTGIYEMTNDIQSLSFEQFLTFDLSNIKRNK